jgi:uncharacterized membrane protein YbhN (UPF0104 family)
VFVLGFSGRAPAASLLGALVAFRAIYYLLPFAVATVTLLAIELGGRRPQRTGEGALAART